MVSVLDSRSSGPGSGPVLSPPRCINGYRRNAGGNPAMYWHPIQGGVKKLLLVASCHRNQDKLRL